MGNIKIGNLSIDKVYFGNNEVDKIYYGNAKIYESGPVVDPVLNNNSWAVIKQVCESGQASNYWAVGDTKTDLGTDGNTRTFRISDMQGLYNKHCVFEQVNIVSNATSWNTSNNTDWSGSSMRNTVLPAELLKFSSDLQAIITDTTIITAKSGNNGTLINTTQKLFLPAGKEVGRSSYCRAEENSALTTWSYWLTHTSDTNHKKYDENNTARTYWLRSPASGYNWVCYIKSDGDVTAYNATDTYCFAPCFAL